MGGRSGEGPTTGNKTGGGGGGGSVGFGGWAKQVEYGGGDPGNAPYWGAEAAGQSACARGPLHPLCP